MIQTGNLNQSLKNNPQRRGWFIGHFIEDDSPFKTDDFEFAWAQMEKGEVKKSLINRDEDRKTLEVLISGKQKVVFQDSREVILVNSGDYLFYDPTMPHTTEALEDCVAMAIRWPSKVKNKSK